jgi:uncharacterized protein
MNVVLDTNVLIAAFIEGFCHTLVEQCLRVHSVIVSEFILNEVRETLTKCSPILIWSSFDFT